MRQKLKALWQDDGGASAVEYGLLLALIAMLTAGALTTMGISTNNLFTSVKDNMNVT